MRVAGRIVGVKTDGYERFVRVEVGGNKTLVVISSIVSEQCVGEQGTCRTYVVGQDFDAEVRLVYVCEAETVTKDHALGFFQPISESPHAVVIGRVTEVTAPDEFVCAVDEEGSQIAVSTEKAFQLQVGMRVKLSGELNHAG